MTHGHFESTFSKYAFGRGEGVTKKSTLCTLVKMMTIMDDPLGRNEFANAKDNEFNSAAAYIENLA